MPKAYKVKKDSLQYDVVASSYDEVVEQGCEKLKLSVDKYDITLEDGTIIGEGNFASVEENSVLIFRPKNGKEKEIVDNLRELISEIKETSNKNIAEIIQSLKQKDGEKLRAILEFILEQEENTAETKEIKEIKETKEIKKIKEIKETKEDDPQWFEGLHEKWKKKSKFMNHKAQCRMRNYRDITQRELKKKFFDATDDNDKRRVAEVLSSLNEKLKIDKFQGALFDRTDQTKSLCDSDGEFECGGLYNEQRCKHTHIINPYITKAHLCIFKNWNLDHQIEKGREVIPNLIEAIENCPEDKRVNSQYFYELLFTMENLKFVEPDCHDTKRHNLFVDLTRVFKDN